jgi:uncharacterized protein YceK
MRSQLHQYAAAAALRNVRAALCAALGIAAAPTGLAAAPVFTTLYTFTDGADGENPYLEGLAPGPNGSLIGTVQYAPAIGWGTAFQLTPPSNGGTAWNFSLIHTFTDGTDGGFPGALVEDEAGNVYGEAQIGGRVGCIQNGQSGCGLVFELSPPAQGQSAWTETVLYNFKGQKDGSFPQNGLVRDAAGDLFGVTYDGPGCESGCGTVFELSPPPQGQTAWTFTTLYAFDDKEGGPPYIRGFPLVLDGAGNIYGETLAAGDDKGRCHVDGGCGTLFELTPPSGGGTSWTKTTLWTFDGDNGSVPVSALTLDPSGNLLGMTNHGGSHTKACPAGQYGSGCGTVFELSPTGGKGDAWTLSLPWEFTNGKDGAFPYGAGMTPFNGKYITTTSGDEITTYGTIDLFTPPTDTHAHWKEKTLYTFTNGADGEQPTSLLLQRGGVFYGMTYGLPGDTKSGAPYGTIFSIKP